MALTFPNKACPDGRLSAIHSSARNRTNSRSAWMASWCNPGRGAAVCHLTNGGSISYLRARAKTNEQARIGDNNLQRLQVRPGRQRDNHYLVLSILMTDSGKFASSNQALSRYPAATRLMLCVSGIYFFFLTWGVMQERLSSTAYPNALYPALPPAKFRSFALLNALQSLVSVLVAWLSSHYLYGSAPALSQSPPYIEYLKVAATSCLASPLGYAAIKHLNYPTVVLGKSCKLLPLVLLSVLVHRKRFSAHKWATVLLVTLGVSGFMVFDRREATDADARQASSNSLYGVALLLCNLLLDGATNTWQDQMFAKYRIRSHQMMLNMNMLSFVLLSGFLVFSDYFTGTLSSAIAFLRQHPSALRDMLAFCACGAMGQVFIFATIEHFGSMLLVTVTVTRKLFTILLSLFWFQHRLSAPQWACVGVVFAGLAIESFFKQSSKGGDNDKKRE